MKITVVCEKNPSMDTPEGKEAYPEGMGEYIAQFLRGAGHNVTLVPAGETGVEGLSDVLLEETDVMFWWGHWYHGAVSDELAAKVAYRARRGMGMVFLHSAHMAKPFTSLLGTTCTLSWREDGEKERLWCVDPTHPIAKGLGEFIDIPREEMYGEPFDIPVPDELVYIGWFEGGEVFRGGCVFHRGRGKSFYFNPGHETYPTYRLPQVQKLLLNAAEYVAPQEKIADRIECRHFETYSIER